MRHTCATWSLTAGMSIFTLACRMGASVQVIDATHGHLVRDADDQDRDLLEAFDAARGHAVGTNSDATGPKDSPETEGTTRLAGGSL